MRRSVLDSIFVLLVVTQFRHISTFESRLCGFGRTIQTNRAINGEYFSNTTDATNSNKPIWYHTKHTLDITIEWGEKYHTSINDETNTRYIIKPTGSTSSYYSYCNLENTHPNDCDENWFVHDGTGYFRDTTYLIHNCSYFWSHTSDCLTNESYYKELASNHLMKHV